MGNIGCEKVQGYSFGKPPPYDEAPANLKDQGIEIELPQDGKHCGDISKIDYLSSVPFMTREKHDAIVTARQLIRITSLACRNKLV